MTDPAEPPHAADPPGAADPLAVRPIGVVRSPLTDAADAPPQGEEGGAEATLELDADLVDGLHGLVAGQRLLVLTWLHAADRDVLRVRPRGDPERPERGVFLSRSPHRPNPIGLHPVTVTAVEGRRVRVRPLEALDGTPILDLKTELARDPDTGVLAPAPPEAPPDAPPEP